MKNIAIIPARGGSKRLPNKNIKSFFGKKILERTFLITKKSRLFHKIVLSTEDNKIKKIGKKIGFDVIWSRPKKLSNDKTKTIDVIKDFVKKNNLSPLDNICCIYPCNPFLDIRDLKKCLKILKSNKENFIFPITNYTHPIQRSFTLKLKNKVKFDYPKNVNKNTQLFKKRYHDAGQFYWGKSKEWKKKKSIQDNGIGHIIPLYRAVDIDDHDDWIKAKYLFLGKKKLDKSVLQ